MSDSAVVEFIRLLPKGLAPKRADRSAAGHLPARAMRYCEALTSATGYGYWFFPPIDLDLMWDGQQVFWSFGDDDEWYPLSGSASGSIQFPGFADTFDDLAPERLRGYSPPFLSVLPENGNIQIWTGYLAKTRPGWSLMVRAPVNLNPIPGLFTWEGIVETDVWTGPLFNNFRFIKTDVTVKLRANTPFLQVQPIPQTAYRGQAVEGFTASDAGSMSEADWGQLARILLPDPDQEARQGLYAVTVRRRRPPPGA